LEKKKNIEKKEEGDRKNNRKASRIAIKGASDYNTWIHFSARKINYRNGQRGEQVERNKEEGAGGKEEGSTFRLE